MASHLSCTDLYFVCHNSRENIQSLQMGPRLLRTHATLLMSESPTSHALLPMKDEGSAKATSEDREGEKGFKCGSSGGTRVSFKKRPGIEMRGES